MDPHSTRNDITNSAITALLILKDTIIVGEGTYLHLYDISDGQHLCRHNIFRASVIHGIKASSHGLAIFGQKSLRLGHVGDGSFTVTSQVAEFPDWIWDLQWLSEPDEHLAVALAHNTVTLWNCAAWQSVRTVSCEENCILYTAHIIGCSWESLIIAAGVVFNEVVLWCLGNQNAGRCPVLGRCQGHEGVIFNIDYNHSKQMLCSVSDDRTIRLWRLSTDDITSSGQPIRTLYGHSARVWDAKLLTDVIVSIGEDACCIIWTYTGQILKKFTGHKGQNIWSLAVEENRNIIVTGGGDSSIRVWPLTSNTSNEHTTDYLDIDVAVAASLGLPDISANDFTPRLVCLLEGSLLVVLQNGYLLEYVISAKSWRLVLHNEDFQSYCVMRESPDKKKVAVGTIKGNIWLYRVSDGSCLVHLSVYPGKVLSLCWGSDEDLFSSGPEGSLVWWKIKENDSWELLRLCEFLLPHSRHRWLTCVTLLPGDAGFVCGDKQGSVFLYKMNSEASTGPCDPCDKCVVVHGKTGVSFVGQHEGFVYSAGRDGTYRKYALTDGCRLVLLNTFKVFKGFDWLERLFFTDSGIIVMGFHSADFLVFNTSTNETLLKMSCGGGHRSWGACYTTKGAVLVFIKAKQVVLCASKDPGPAQIVVKPPLHGRVIRCILFLAQFNLIDGTECALLVTGSEDTAVNVNAFLDYSDRPPVLVPIHRLQGHISAVCGLSSCPSSIDHQSVLLFTVGGRMAIHIWRVAIPCQSSRGTLAKDIRVDHLAFSGTVDNAARRRHLKKLKASNLASDPETRFMDIKLHRTDTNDTVLLYLAGSDGLIRLFSFCETSRDLVELCHSDIYSCCFLSLLLYHHPVPTNSSRLLFSGGTDGNILVWDISVGLSDSRSTKGNSQAIDCCSRRCSKHNTPLASGRSMEVITQSSLPELNEESCCEGSCSPNSATPCNVMNECNTPMDRASQDARNIGEFLEGTHNREMSLSDRDALTSERAESSFPMSGNLSISSEAATAASSLGYDIPAGGSQERDAVTMATEGLEMGDVLLTLRAHQSGVNALAAKQLDSGRGILLGSGGDDGAIHVHLLGAKIDKTGIERGNKPIITVLKRISQVSAHAAQVTGLSFLGSDWLISTSVDQRLNTWSINSSSVDSENKELSLSSCAFVAVPDISGLAVWTNRAGVQYVAISGHGVEIVHLQGMERPKYNTDNVLPL